MKEFQEKSNEELMEIYISGHPDNAYLSFNELYERYKKRVYLYCQKKLNSKTDIEDCLQKIFLKLHEKKHLYNKKFKFEQWIFVISKTVVIDHLRKQKSDLKKIEQIIGSEDVILPQDFNESDLLSKLSKDEFEILELKYVDDLTYAEISSVLNKTEVSLRKLVSRTIAKIRNG